MSIMSKLDIVLHWQSHNCTVFFMYIMYIFQPDDGQGDTGSLGNQPGAYFFAGKFFIVRVLFL